MDRPGCHTCLFSMDANNQWQDRKLVAVLAADIVGFSRLTSADEEGCRRWRRCWSSSTCCIRTNVAKIIIAALCRATRWLISAMTAGAGVTGRFRDGRCAPRPTVTVMSASPTSRCASICRRVCRRMPWSSLIYLVIYLMVIGIVVWLLTLLPGTDIASSAGRRGQHA